MRPVGLILLIVITSCWSSGTVAADIDSGADSRRLSLLAAALTDHRAALHKAAMEEFIAFGEASLPTLDVLTTDPHAAVRRRVALVAGEIGGPSALELLLRLTEDKDAGVREVAALALGGCAGDQAFARLRELLRDPLPAIRESAAIALGGLRDLRAIPLLAGWPDAGGEVARLQLQYGREGERQVQRIRVAMQSALLGLVGNPAAVPMVIGSLRRLAGTSRQALLEATWELGDPRLCPVLVEIVEEGQADNRVIATVSLAANGDSRALPTLVRVAQAGRGELARRAAQALMRLTGYTARSGPAWSLWWADHQERVRALHERDAFIARLHDRAFVPDRADLAAFSVAELWPLVVGCRGDGAEHWPRLAWRAIQLDDRARWRRELLSRYDAGGSQRERVELVVLLDALGGSEAALRQRLQALRIDPAAAVLGSLRQALQMASGELEPAPRRIDRRK